MALRGSPRFTLNVILFSAMALLVACAVPLGSSYTVEKQTVTVHFVPQPQSHLEVESRFQLLASGTRPLDAVAVNLPDEKAFPAQDLHFALDGQNVSSVPPGNLPNHSVQLRFESPWEPGKRRNLVVQYNVPLDTAVAGFAPGFVAAGRWNVSLSAPQGMFAKLNAGFKKWDLEIRVPEDFLVHSSGRVRHSRRENGQLILRAQHQIDDVPFIVAGRYQQQAVRNPPARKRVAGRADPRQGNDEITFWTLRPLDPQTAIQAGSQVAQLKRAYDQLFDPRTRKLNAIWIVECPSGAPRSDSSENSRVPESSYRSCDSALPDTILLQPVGTDGFAGKLFYDNINRALAYLWLSHAALPAAQDALALDGIYDYAARAVLLEGRGAAERRDSIAACFSKYDKSQRQSDAHSKPPPGENSRFSNGPSSKSVLFFFALEDQYGPQHLRRAIARAVHARGEQGYNLDDLRSALESETQKNAAEFFRRWFNEPGIPKDFRARYKNDSGPAPSDKETEQ